MSHISTRICVPNLVAVRRSCRKKGGVQTDRQTDRQTDKRTLQLYIIESGIVGYNVIGVYRWILTTFIDLVWMVAGVWSDQALEMILKSTGSWCLE